MERLLVNKNESCDDNNNSRVLDAGDDRDDWDQNETIIPKGNKTGHDPKADMVRDDESEPEKDVIDEIENLAAD